MTDPGATGTRSRPTPPLLASAFNARPRNPPGTPRAAGTVGAPSTRPLTQPPHQPPTSPPRPPRLDLKRGRHSPLLTQPLPPPPAMQMRPQRLYPPGGRAREFIPNQNQRLCPPRPPCCPPRGGPAATTTPATLRPPLRFHRLPLCERVEMARTPRPRGPRAETYTETNCIYRCAHTFGTPGGDLSWPFP